MLSSLSIQDFVIVEQLDLHFESGMSVLSGETGAGKSILIDALSLCLGARADVGQVREGCERANITAVFSGNPASELILQDQALPIEDELHLRRSIDAKGKSRAFVNGVSVPAATLKLLAESLIDIHGQHAFQALAKPTQQLDILDSFGQHQALLEQTRKAYKALTQAQTLFEQAQTGQSECETRLENLRWKLSTLEGMSPKEGQWEELTVRHEKLSHGAELIEGAQSALNTLNENDGSVLEQVSHLIDQLSRLARTDPELESVVKNLS
ncbi:MAG: AAA family ATPase, partial [Limnobacter sp.]|nr:AAA family ATPase [Limnobacter sp.]